MYEGLFQPRHLFIIFLLFFLIFVSIIPYWKIFQKAGFSPALSLLMLVPIANLALLFFLAFADWPALKKSE